MTDPVENAPEKAKTPKLPEKTWTIKAGKASKKKLEAIDASKSTWSVGYRSFHAETLQPRFEVKRADDHVYLCIDEDQATLMASLIRINERNGLVHWGEMIVRRRTGPKSEHAYRIHLKVKIEE